MVAGYATLSATGASLGELPPDLGRGLGRHRQLPVTLIGLLAVDHRYHGLGLGEALLLGALARALQHARQVVATAVIVDPLDPAARRYSDR